MEILLSIYMILSIVLGISAMTHGAIYAGIAGVVGPGLCCFALSGLRGSLMVGDRSQKIGGAVLGGVLLAAGIGIVLHSGYSLVAFGVSIPGVVWCIVGAAVGWLSTTRRHAEAK